MQDNSPIASWCSVQAEKVVKQTVSLLWFVAMHPAPRKLTVCFTQTWITWDARQILAGIEPGSAVVSTMA